MQQAAGESEDDYITVSDLSNGSMQQPEVDEIEAFWDANPDLPKLTTWAVLRLAIPAHPCKIQLISPAWPAHLHGAQIALPLPRFVSVNSFRYFDVLLLLKPCQKIHLKRKVQLHTQLVASLGLI